MGLGLSNAGVLLMLITCGWTSWLFCRTANSFWRAVWCYSQRTHTLHPFPRYLLICKLEITASGKAEPKENGFEGLERRGNWYKMGQSHVMQSERWDWISQIWGRIITFLWISNSMPWGDALSAYCLYPHDAIFILFPVSRTRVRLICMFIHAQIPRSKPNINIQTW